MSALINTFEPQWLKSGDAVKRYAQLLAIRDLESRGAVGLATKLRLTNQSRYTTQAAGTAAKNAPIGPKPWEL